MENGLNKPRIRKWVNALRSGKYKKTTGRLKGIITSKPTYCCLGVACEISKLDTWDYDGYYDDAQTELPGSVCDYYGFQSGDPEVTLTRTLVVKKSETKYLPGDRVHLARLNDDFGLSFKKIADLIEREFLAPKKKKKKTT